MRDYISSDTHIINFDNTVGIMENCTLDGYTVDYSLELNDNETLVVSRKSPETWQCIIINNGKIDFSIYPYFSKQEALHDAKTNFKKD